MSRRVHFVLVVVCLALLAPGAAQAQQAQPDTFTFVALWNVPREQWDAFTANFEKNTRPELDRLVANGTLNGWGSFAAVVHDPEDYTHGVWFSAGSIAGIERARGELIKLPTAPGQAAAKHRDYFLRSLIRSTRATAPASGYLLVASSVVKPGMGQQWREAWEKYNKPVYDDLVKNGTITMYDVEVEQVHTTDAGLRYIVYVTPNAEGVDKVRAAFAAVTQKRSAEERRAIGTQFADMTVAGAHRDFLAWLSAYTIK